MKSIFKKGDAVMLIDAKGMFNLELNVTYIVVDIQMKNDEQFISLKDVLYEDDIFHYEEYPSFNSRRFKKSIKYERRKKLQKIYNL